MRAGAALPVHREAVGADAYSQDAEAVAQLQNADYELIHFTKCRWGWLGGVREELGLPASARGNPPLCPGSGTYPELRLQEGSEGLWPPPRFISLTRGDPPRLKSSEGLPNSRGRC